MAKKALMTKAESTLQLNTEFFFEQLFEHQIMNILEISVNTDFNKINCQLPFIYYLKRSLFSPFSAITI